MDEEQKIIYAERKKRRKRRIRSLIFILEILILFVLVAGLFLFSKMDQLNYHELNSSEVQVNDEATSNQLLKKYTTIALVGVDSRDGNLANANSDSMIIVSINNRTKKIKLVSVYRDTYLRTGQDEDGNGIYGKANSAYSRGSSERFLSMLNTNLDLNIQEYVTVDFTALATVTDLLGGIDIQLKEEEIKLLNDHCRETASVTGLTYEPLDVEAGVHHLNGVQAVAYSRIRYTEGMDMRRAARQREVIYKLVDKIKSANISTLSSIIDEVFPMVRTSLSKMEIVKLAMGLLSYEIEDQAGFPHDHLLGKNVANAVGVDCVLPVTLESNVIWLHNFLYDAKDYKPSENVKKYSDWIVQKSGYGEDSRLEHSEDGSLDSYH